MDIAEILKKCPKGTKLYSLVDGEVTLENISNTGQYRIEVSVNDWTRTYFTKDGLLFDNRPNGECVLFPSKDQRDWNKFGTNDQSTDQKPKIELKPFDKVLVRDSNYGKWECDIFNHIDNGIYNCFRSYWCQCIKYEGNEHLLGTINKPEMENKEFDFHEIKTFEDACKRLGLPAEALTVESFGVASAFSQANALYKLLIIQKAINNNKWCNEDGWNYYPYWVLFSKEEIESMSEEERQKKGIRQLRQCAGTWISGVCCAHVDGRGAYTYTDCSFPLRYNSNEAALYAAKQFEDLFFQYYGIKVKE